MTDNYDEEAYTTILLSDLSELQERSEKLAKLEAYGVDNWDGYSDALRMEF